MCCRHAVEYVPVNLGTIQDFVERGRLDASQPITDVEFPAVADLVHLDFVRDVAG